MANPDKIMIVGAGPIGIICRIEDVKTVIVEVGSSLGPSCSNPLPIKSLEFEEFEIRPAPSAKILKEEHKKEIRKGWRRK